MQDEKIRMEGFADYESKLWNLIADARLLLTPDYCWRPRLRDPKAWSDQKAEKLFLQVGFVCWYVQVVVKLDFSFISSCFNVMNAPWSESWEKIFLQVGFNIGVLKLHILFSRIITANFKGFLHLFTELYTAYALQEFWNCVFAIATSSL